MGFLEDAGNFVGGGVLFGSGGGLDGLNRISRAEELYGGVDPNGNIARTAGAQEGFAGQGAAGYGTLGREAAGDRRGLRRSIAGYGRLASGQDSVSAEQLRQAYDQAAGTQMGIAASAAPANSAMAARNASMNVGRIQGGLAGQQAVAGLQERRQAMDAELAARGLLQQGVMGQRGQDLQATLGGGGNALAGYGNIEANRTSRYGAVAGAPTPGEQLLGGAMGAGQAAMMMSDERAKTDIEDGEADAAALLATLEPKVWRYKNEKHGKGTFLGPMAQDLEKSRAGRAAVVETPEGKKVDGGRLAAALASTLPLLDRRLAKLEKRKAA